MQAQSIPVFEELVRKITGGEGTYAVIELGARLEEQNRVEVLESTGELIYTSRETKLLDLRIEEGISQTSCSFISTVTRHFSPLPSNAMESISKNHKLTSMAQQMPQRNLRFLLLPNRSILLIKPLQNPRLL